MTTGTGAWHVARGITTQLAAGAEPTSNRPSIQPVKLLSPGTWRLTLMPGIKSKDGKHRLDLSWTQPFGKVEPFDIRELRAESYAQSGGSLGIEFSHDLAPDITLETADRFLSIEPPVRNLRFE